MGEAQQDDGTILYETPRLAPRYRLAVVMVEVHLYARASATIGRYARQVRRAYRKVQAHYYREDSRVSPDLTCSAGHRYNPDSADRPVSSKRRFETVYRFCSKCFGKPHVHDAPGDAGQHLCDLEC